MLDFDTTLDMLKKYGYSSTVHPYVYQNGDTIGVCYSYIDEDYGTLERIRLFDDADYLEDFLKKLDWLKNNGKKYNVRMVLDNYESINPKVIFLRNEKVMVEGEMFDIDNYDYRESQRLQMDDVSKVIYEAGDLLLVYDEIKGRQLQYLKSIVKLKNLLRQKYYDLQKEVDKYNKYKVERELILLPEVADIGINEMLEINIKDRYNMYVAQRPSYQEAVDFVREVWELNKSLELNVKYYEALKEENDIRNELKIVEQKLELMKNLNEEYKPLFGVDLVGKFKKINKACRKFSNSISDEFISENINTINRKYSVFDSLDLLYTSDYLREAIQNTNYADLAIKYSKDLSVQEVGRSRKPLNEVAASLSIQYRDKLSVEEQAILVLYNNHKYRKLCNCILNIPDFEKEQVKKIIRKLNGLKGFSKIKTECYDIVKKRIDDPINANIKNMLFKDYDFTTFETFISSLIKELVKLRNVNNKMILNGDINMYLVVNKEDEIAKEKFLLVTNSLNSLLIETKDTSQMIGITLLKESSPVLYSPYYFDIGDIYSKNASLQMSIKEMVDFELLVETSDIIINVDPFKTNVVRYYSEPVAIDNVLVVNDLKMNYKTKFCKFAFTSNIVGVEPEVTVSQDNTSNNMAIETADSNLVDDQNVNGINEQEHVGGGQSVSSTSISAANNEVSPVIPIMDAVSNNVEVKQESSEKEKITMNIQEDKVEHSSASDLSVAKPEENHEEIKPFVQNNNSDVVSKDSSKEVKQEPVVSKPVVSNSSEKVTTSGGVATREQAVVKKVEQPQAMSTKPVVKVVENKEAIKPVAQNNNSDVVSKDSSKEVKQEPVVSKPIVSNSSEKVTTSGVTTREQAVVKKVEQPQAMSTKPVVKVVENKEAIKPGAQNNNSDVVSKDSSKEVKQEPVVSKPIVSNSSEKATTSGGVATREQAVVKKVEQPQITPTKPVVKVAGQEKTVLEENKVDSTKVE